MRNGLEGIEWIIEEFLSFKVLTRDLTKLLWRALFGGLGKHNRVGKFLERIFSFRKFIQVQLLGLCKKWKAQCYCK